MADALLILGLTILYHPDVSRIGERVPLPGLMSGREELLSRGEPAFYQPEGSLLRPLPLADPHLSRRPIRLVPGPDPGGVRLICGESSAAVVVNGEAIAGERDLTAAEIDQGAVLLLAQRVVVLLSRIEPVAPCPPRFGRISPARRSKRVTSGAEVTSTPWSNSWRSRSGGSSAGWLNSACVDLNVAANV